MEDHGPQGFFLWVLMRCARLTLTRPNISANATIVSPTDGVLRASMSWLMRLGGISIIMVFPRRLMLVDGGVIETPTDAAVKFRGCCYGVIVAASKWIRGSQRKCPETLEDCHDKTFYFFQCLPVFLGTKCASP
jgi:hypothetical protein